METLNKKDRNKAFILFICLFIITTCLIMFAVFCNYKIPYHQIKRLEIENKVLQNGLIYQKKFEKKAELLKKYIDSIDVPGNDTYYFQQKSINMLIDIENSLLLQDTLLDKSLYKNFLLTARSLIDAEKAINLYGKNKAQIDTLLTKIEVYKHQIELIKLDLDVCRKINSIN